MIYRLILLFFGILLILAGYYFVVQHWPYGKLIHVSGWVLTAIMTALLMARVVFPKK